MDGHVRASSPSAALCRADRVDDADAHPVCHQRAGDDPLPSRRDRLVRHGRARRGRARARRRDRRAAGGTACRPPWGGPLDAGGRGPRRSHPLALGIGSFRRAGWAARCLRGPGRPLLPALRIGSEVALAGDDGWRSRAPARRLRARLGDDRGLVRLRPAPHRGARCPRFAAGRVGGLGSAGRGRHGSLPLLSARPGPGHPAREPGRRAGPAALAGHPRRRLVHDSRSAS